MTAMMSTISPPAPRPWSARVLINRSMLWDSPARIEPIVKITTDDCSISLRP